MGPLGSLHLTRTVWTSEQTNAKLDKQFTFLATFPNINLLQMYLKLQHLRRGKRYVDLNASQDISDQSKFIHGQSVTPELSL